MFGMGILAPLLPSYAAQMGSSGLMLGLIFSGFSIGRLFTMPIVGPLSDKYGRKRFIAFGLAVQVLTAVGFLVATSPYELLATRIFQGIAGATIIPIAMAMVGEISPAGKESTYLGYFSVALFAGFGLGPLAGGVIKDLLSINANFFLLGGMGLAALIGLLLFMPSKYEVANPKSRQVVPYRTLLANPVLLGLFFYRVATSFGRGVAASLLPLYGDIALGFSASQIGIVISANILTTALLQPLFGGLADRTGRRWLIVVGTVMQALPLFLLFWADTFSSLLALNFLMGIAGAVSLPAASGLVTAEGKKGGMGGSMAIFNIGMSLGLGGGPIIGGAIYDAVGFAPAFIVGGVVVLLAIPPFVLLCRRAQCDGPGKGSADPIGRRKERAS